MDKAQTSSPSNDMSFHYWLSIPDAKRICLEATSEGMAIAMFEGFIRRESSYEARLDCIWNPKKALSRDDVAANNLDAAHTVEFENEGCDHFILSVWPIERELEYWRDKLSGR